MSGAQYREWILETIDQLRKRKARPDLDRICHMVERKYGLRRTETEANVEKLVDLGAVVKVDYKGNISYRNASRWQKNHCWGQVLNSVSASSRIKQAVTALTENESSSGERKGACAADIEKWLKSHVAADSDPVRHPLHIVLQREVDAGRLEKLHNGNYSTGISETKLATKNSLPKKPAGVPSKRGRPPKRKKEEDVASAPVAPPMDLTLLCDFCQKNCESNRKGVTEQLLVCKDCGAKAHPTCMDYSETLAIRAKRAPWQCIDCKTCYVCSDAGNADCMLFCDACDKGYHMNCHQPEVTEKPLGKWICDDCVYEGVDGTAHRPETLSSTPGTTGYSTSGLPTPCDSPQPSTENQDLNPMALMNGSLVKQPLPKLPKLEGGLYPDASDWSIDEVEMFLQSAGFSQQAEAFREQEIDGKSLLLMKRSDVLTGLAIKLGPALKIYQHVKKLQMAGFNVNVP